MFVLFNETDRSHRREGRFIDISTASEEFKAFVPSRLPPEPPINMTNIQLLHDRTNQALGRLDGVSTLLPDLDSFLRVHVYKEALLSSQIEGTRSTLSEIFEAQIVDQRGALSDDVREVANYVDATNEGLNLLRDGLPFSIRLIKTIHKALMKFGPNSHKQPGEFRSSQNWIGGIKPSEATYVPPPPYLVPDLITELESSYHELREKESTLILIGMVHAHFEMIHPFLDGNGRTGRMLITLLLCSQGILHVPLLYPSLYFKSNRSQYYEQLQRVQTHGDWEGWLAFYLRGMYETANTAIETIKRLTELFEADRTKIRRSVQNSVTPERVFSLFQNSPILNASTIAHQLRVSKPTVRRAISKLESLNILREITERRRSRVYAYESYLEELAKGTEPLD